MTLGSVNGAVMMLRFTDLSQCLTWMFERRPRDRHYYIPHFIDERVRHREVKQHSKSTQLGRGSSRKGSMLF